MKVFVDANIYLNFIRSFDESMDSLEKFKKLVDEERVRLIFPKITQDEVLRHIPDVSAKHTLNMENDGKASVLQFQPAPTYKGSPAIKKLEKIRKEHAVAISELKIEYINSVKKLEEEILIPFIRKALELKESREILDIAWERHLKGNPPGKSHWSIGDEFEWEILIENCTDDDLVIITGDGDWKSENKPRCSDLHPFLKREWDEKSSKSIKLLTSIAEFTNTQIRDKKDKIPEAVVEREKSSNIRTLPLSYAVSPSMGNSNPTLSGMLPSASVSISNGDVSPWANIGAQNLSDFQSFGSISPSSGLDIHLVPLRVSHYPINCDSCGRIFTTGGAVTMDSKFLCPFCADGSI